MAELLTTEPTGPLDIAEWKRRYAAHIMKVASWPEVAAMQNAEAAAAELKECGMFEGFENDPEEAADEEMSNWDDDGDE